MKQSSGDESSISVLADQFVWGMRAIDLLRSRGEEPSPARVALIAKLIQKFEREMSPFGTKEHHTR